MESRDTNLNELRNSISLARYDINPVAVADAIVRRRWSLAVASGSGMRATSASRRGRRAQVSCIARRGAGARMRALAA